MIPTLPWRTFVERNIGRTTTGMSTPRCGKDFVERNPPAGLDHCSPCDAKGDSCSFLSRLKDGSRYQYDN